jgi:hypothetical protein
MLRKRSLLRPAVVPLTLLAAALAATAAVAASGPAQPKSDGTPKSTTVGGVDPSFLTNARTIPHFTFAYTDPSTGQSFPITMAGSDPRNGATSTAIHTVIVPLKFNFVAGNQDTSALNDLGYVGFRATPLTQSFDGTRRVAAVLGSPIFTAALSPADMGGDTAQYGDAFMRSQFNQIGSGYHVTLVNDGVTATQTFDVPAGKGLAYQRPVGAWRTANGMPTDTTGGFVQDNWFSEKIQNLLGSLQISGTVVPIFLTDNVLLYSGNTNYLNCCTIGYHGAGMPIGHGAGSANGNGNQPVHTFIYGAWTKPGTYSGFLSDYTGSRTAPRPTRGLADIHAISHEVAEWLDDPFVNNAVVPWLTPTAPQYGCTGILETGDPVVGVWYPLNGNNTGSADGYNYYGQYHPEEEVFAQWFGHGGVEAAGFHSFPNTDGSNRLTYMGSRTTGLGGAYAGFGTYSKGC